MLMVTIAAVVALASDAPGDWTQWRGPARDGVGSLAPAPTWPAELPRLWRLAVGAGQSSPVVEADTAYVFTREGDSEVARAVDLGTGRERWRRAYPAPHRVYPGAASFGAGPKSTPALYGGRLFTLGIGGVLSAFDAGDGRILWQKDFAGRFKAAAPPFGTSMSPLIAGGRLIVHAGGHDGGALIAFDPATGAESWVHEGEGPSYSSPILANLGGQEQIVIQVHRRIVGVDPATGRVLWGLPFVTPCDQNIVTPLQAGDRIVASSQDTGTQGILVERKGPDWTAAVAWHTNDVSMYMSSPVLVGGRVVGLSHRRRGQYFSLDPRTGAVAWTSEPGRGENAAFLVAGSSLLVLEGDGTLVVAPADGATVTPSRRYRISDGGTYAHPVPSRRGLLIKDQDGLSLFALGRAAAAR